MRIALLADLHGNWPATEELEKDLMAQSVDRVFCLGDAVGKGPSSARTLDWVIANCHVILGGNWDYGIGHQKFPKDVVYWQQLGEERLGFLKSLPREHHFMMSGRRVRLLHGRPVMDELVSIRSDTEKIQPFFVDEQGRRFDVVGYADTHRQAMRTMTPGLFFNCGSVGNAMGEPCCCYAIMEGVEGGVSAPLQISFRTLPYDRAQAILDAKATPDIPHIDAYIREIETGIYSR